jgi:GNAT superfamily N-acetyltransferase
MTLHRTGSIPAGAYETYRKVEGFSWLQAARYPICIGTLATRHGVVRFRQSGEREHYVATDAAGEIVRDEHGEASYLREADVIARGLPTHDETIVAFLDASAIGIASNEWGAVGAWVAEPFQRSGIGTALVRRHLHGRPRARLGQMTVAGEALARAVHRSFLRDPAATSTVSFANQEGRSEFSRAA